MPNLINGDFWGLLSRLRHARPVQTLLTFALVILGPALAFATYLALGQFDLGAASNVLRLILLADTVYILVVAALVMGRLVRMMADRRAHSAGSRLHLRLTVVFAFIALVPTILVAVFAVLTVNIGLEGWFSDRVRGVVGASLAAAEAYEQEQSAALSEDIKALGAFVNLQKQSSFFTTDGGLRPLLAEAQAKIQRGLKEVFLVDSSGAIRTRGERSYLFDYDPPGAEALRRADQGEVVIIPDLSADEYRALMRLSAFSDRYLLVSRSVDGNLLALLDETKETVALYQQLESERGRVLFNFGLLYIGFALLLILAAIWLGFWFAERLSRPVGALVDAAEKVGQGDLSVKVPEGTGDDELVTLGRVFNAMTTELSAQRGALLASHAASEERRRLFDSVLSNVTAGVVGLDAQGQVEFGNRAAARLLDLPDFAMGGPLAALVPEFAGLLARLLPGTSPVQEEVRLSRRGKQETLLVRMARRQSDAGAAEGFVVAFDDVTELVSAQRSAAWGDVARRIAHEIKNPLTPIQLSAERIRRKFRTEVSEPADLDQYTDVIIRQTNDLRRIVDEFSKFARMPEPDRRETDLVALVRAAALLQENGQPGVGFAVTLPSQPILLEIDATMIGQALTNLIKNAGEAIETLMENSRPEGFVPQIRIALAQDSDWAEVTIMDNGIGLPPDRARLFEPYVTTREKGTGLGLPIVKKIIEEHGGSLALQDAPAFDGAAHHGAMAVIRLPMAAPRKAGRTIGAAAQGGR